MYFANEWLHSVCDGNIIIDDDDERRDLGGIN